MAINFRTNYEVSLDADSAIRDRFGVIQHTRRTYTPGLDHDHITVRLTASVFLLEFATWASDEGGIWVWDGTLPNGWQWEFQGDRAAADKRCADLDAFVQSVCRARDAAYRAVPERNPCLQVMA